MPFTFFHRHDILTVMTKTLLGQILVNEGFITPQQLDAATKKKHLYPRMMIGDILVLMGYLTTDKLHIALKIQREGKSSVLSQTKPQIDNTSLNNLSRTQSSLIEILIKKKIFTRDELLEMLRQS